MNVVIRVPLELSKCRAEAPLLSGSAVWGARRIVPGLDCKGWLKGSATWGGPAQSCYLCPWGVHWDKLVWPDTSNAGVWYFSGAPHIIEPPCYSHWTYYNNCFRSHNFLTGLTVLYLYFLMNKVALSPISWVFIEGGEDHRQCMDQE